MSEYSSEHKLPVYEIKEMTNQDGRFYDLVGPLLAQRAIAKEVGSPLWDDAQKVWHVAVTQSDEVIGLIAFDSSKQNICSFYVEPKSRGKLVGQALIHSVIQDAEFPVSVVASENAKELFLLNGFREVGQRGRFSIMELST